MEINNTPTNQADPKQSFWQRQFSVSSTLPQTIFDVVFGILMPIICFYFDPGILRGEFRDFFPGTAALFIYAFSLIAIVTLSLWLVLGRRDGPLSGVLGGVFLSAALCSFVIGVLILPLTLIGLLVIIGVLGFVPFVTGFVYLRNAIRAISRGAALERRNLVAKIVVSAVLVIGLPAFAHWGVKRVVTQSIDQILSGDSGSAEEAARRVRFFSPLADTASLDRLVLEYDQESDNERKERLEKAYMEITGERIHTRLSVLND
jgi:cytochrome bd-type quinol oxidase subunit 2